MERPIRTQKYYELLLLLPESPHLSSIVPTYQEAQNLLLVVAEIVAELAQVIPDCALIIGDDHSQDGTVTVYQILRAKDFLIWLVIHTHTRGLACAVIEGCAYARAPILLVLDVDLCRPAMAILQLYHAICDGAECAIGARYVSGDETDEPWNWSRWLNSKVARLLAQSLVFLHAPLAGFFTLQRCLPLTPSGYRIAPEMLIKSRATNLREIPGVLRTRRCGESTLTLTQPLLSLRHLCSLSLDIFSGFCPYPGDDPPAFSTVMPPAQARARLVAQKTDPLTEVRGAQPREPTL